MKTSITETNYSPAQVLLKAYHGRIFSLLDYLVEFIDHYTVPDCSYINKANATDADPHLQSDYVKRYFLKDSDPLPYQEIILSAVVAGSDTNRKKMRICPPSAPITEVSFFG